MIRAPLLLLLLATTPAAGGEPAVRPGDSGKILLDERAGCCRRSFRLHLPSGLGLDAGSRPLVLVLHGGFGSGRIVERQSGFSELADREGFFVAYPNGLGVFGLARHWNGGYCCARAMKKELDDVGFLDRVIDWIADRHPVDPRRIYLVGYSNGGMLAYRYAAERGGRLAGLAIWASSVGSRDGGHDGGWHLPEPEAELPVLIAHGLEDRRLPFEETTERGEHQTLLGAVGSAEWWAQANGCTEPPEIREHRGGAVDRRTFCPGSPAPVALLALEGWGHDWPGPRKTDRLSAAEPLRGYHLAEEMWSFFSRPCAESGDPAQPVDELRGFEQLRRLEAGGVDGALRGVEGAVEGPQ